MLQTKNTGKMTSMEIRSKRKMLFLALAICIIFAVVFTELLASDDYEHDCVGEGCPICLQIQMTANFLRTLKMAGFTVFFAFVLIFLVQTPKKFTEFATLLYSPVALKVRFNT